MITHAQRFTLQHLIAAAAVAGTATAVFLSKLDVLAVRLSPAVRQTCAQWWPLLLILAGGILWLVHEKSRGTARQGVETRATPPATRERIR